MNTRSIFSQGRILKKKKQSPKMSVNEPALCLGRRLGGQLPTASNRPQHQAEEAAPT